MFDPFNLTNFTETLRDVTVERFGVNPYMFRDRFREIIINKRRAFDQGKEDPVLPRELIWWKTGLFLSAYRSMRNDLHTFQFENHRNLDAYIFFGTVLNAAFPLAVPVLWRWDMWDSAVAGALEAFTGSTLDVSALDPPVQLWITETEPQAYGDIPEELTANLFPPFDRPEEWIWTQQWLLLINIDHPKLLFPAADRSTALLTYSSFAVSNIRTGQNLCRIFPQPVPRDELITRYDLASLQGLVSFMNQPIVRQIKHRPHEQEARKLKAVGIKPWEAREIILRRAMPDGRHSMPTEVEWSCQWFVRGHWRKQWYATIQEHKPKFISTYVKGPADKPLRKPRASVIVVGR